MARIAKARLARIEFKASWNKAIAERRAVMFRWPDGRLNGREYPTVEAANKAVTDFEDFAGAGAANIIEA